MLRYRLPALAAATGLVLTACAGGGGTGDGGSGPEVVVTAYPMQFIAEQVVGEAGTVVSVAPAGTEPHDLELSPSGIATLSGADVALVLSSFQSAVDDALTQVGDDVTVVDAADSADLVEPGDTELEITDEPDDHEGDDEHGDEGEHGEEGEDAHEGEDDHDHGALDPHFWLDPMRVADVADALAETLATSSPDDAADYRANAAALREQLTTLDGEIAAGLAGCTDRTFVTSHEAFGYLASAYDLEQIGISGLDPEAEPSPARIAEVLRQAREAGVTTVFNEPGGVVAGADDLAAELGVTLATLDPLELEPADGGYLGTMRTNLTTLRDGLACR